VFQLADELHTSSDISDDLWRALGARFSEREILELIVTAGWYHTIAYICNGVRVQDEEWAEPQPGRIPTG
jgi:alkylhydroperoxidase family enzyme